ncbi:hypothetical protein ElyMa_003117700 [Elysia marginata]|uniref:Cation-transporting P-type ATPase N-terminal domain-containing protein n=1 Tax=Elysia marginata TaxID=1093978 RepID=A0AAV4ITS0_9GAST|nr:hypothetical protein ElyMa_003117700 [Elysia marginata]
MTEERSAPRPPNEEEPWVKISTSQLTDLMKALDETRALLNDFYQSQVGTPGPRQVVTRRRKSWWGRHCCPSGRKFLYRNITLITVILQFLNLMMLTVMDVLPKHLVQHYKMIIASSATMIALEVLNLFILILATGR